MSCIFTKRKLINEGESEFRSRLCFVCGARRIATCSVYEPPGSKIFGATLSTTDAYGSVTRYFYDEAKGYLLATVNENENVGTCYTYDSFGNLVSVMPAEISEGSYTPVTDSASVEYTYNGRNLLSSVTTESTTYNFTYDSFGNSLATLVGDTALATYEYYQNNGKLFSVIYGNDFSVEYLYNALELVSEIWYNYADDRGELAYSYEYDAEDRLYKFTDHLNQQITLYTYDSNDRVTGSSTYDSSEIPLLDIGLIYDDQSRVSNVTYNLGGYISYRYNVGGKVSYGYNYDHDGSLSIETVFTSNGQRQISYTYDGLDRLTKFTSTSSGSFTISGEYIYRDVGENLTGAQISQYKSTVANSTDVYSFEYDVLGNITKVIYNSAAETRYVYDELNQLVREDNAILNKTFLYTYDNAGNILKKEEFSLTPADAEPANPTATYLYGYGNSQWGDQMTSFDGHTITYDEVGNPINYYNGSDYTFTWTGRRLTGATYNGKTLSFVYNDDGIRTSKTVNGVTTTYILNGSTIIGEITGDAITMYFYDASGSVIGMQYHGADYATNVWDIYWFEKNLQGDIVAVYDNTGTKLVSYTYDAWGNFVETVSASGANSTALNNPFRYRGYYYDTDLCMYYLQSRYYDSATCRFINVDGYINANGDLVGFNMYAYCSNNPVMYVDPSGSCKRFLGFLWKVDCKQTSCPNSKYYIEPKSVEPEGTYNKGRGQVYIITEDQLEEFSNVGNNVVVILDQRTADDPNMKILNSYKIKNRDQQKDIAQIMLDYNIANPVEPDWVRTKDSIVDEWIYHNIGYYTRKKTRGSTADCDLNNADEGVTFWDLVMRSMFK